MAIVRQTGGYIDKQGNRKEWDKLSTSRIMELAGLSNRSVIDAVNEAIKDGWIERREAGQYFEYRISPMKKVHSLSNEPDETCELFSQVDEESYENSSQVSYENSSQVDATYEKSSQEPMKKVHTQKKRKKINNIHPENEPTTESAEWFSAMCWLVYGHKDYKLLSDGDRIAVGKTIKHIRASPNKYTVDDLRAWYRDKWCKEWPGKQAGKSEIQRPSLKQIKTGIGQVKAVHVNGFSQDTSTSRASPVAGELER